MMNNPKLTLKLRSNVSCLLNPQLIKPNRLKDVNIANLNYLLTLV